MVNVYGVEFSTLSEFSRALGFSKPFSKSGISKIYGTIEHCADARLKMHDLDLEQKKALLEQKLAAEKDRARARKSNAPEKQVLNNIFRMIINNAAFQDYQTCSVISGCEYSAETIRDACKAFTNNLNILDAIRVLQEGKKD